MHTAEKVWSGIGAAVFGLAMISAGSGATTPTAALAVSRSVDAAQTETQTQTQTQTQTPSRSTVTVTDVLDGDTLVAGDEVIRVLGIDSCDAATPGGAEARRMAQSLLGGRQVTVRAEPGVDRDAAGRLLRYVDLGFGGDYGDYMVSFDHTRPDTSNGADRRYVAQLREDDPNGRTCG